MSDKIRFSQVITHTFRKPFADTPLFTAAEMLALSGLLYEQPENAGIASDVLRDIAFDRLRDKGCTSEELDALLTEVGMFILDV